MAKGQNLIAIKKAREKNKNHGRYKRDRKNITLIYSSIMKEGQ